MPHDPDAIGEGAVGLVVFLAAHLDRLGAMSIREFREELEGAARESANPALDDMVHSLTSLLRAVEVAREPGAAFQVIQGGRSEETQPEQSPPRDGDEEA